MAGSVHLHRDQVLVQMDTNKYEENQFQPKERFILTKQEIRQKKVWILCTVLKPSYSLNLTIHTSCQNVTLPKQSVVLRLGLRA